MKPGVHQLTIRVDNRVKEIDPGMNSHSISDHTQSNWNGIVGRIELESFPGIYIEKLQVFPDLSTHQARVDVWLNNESDVKQTVDLQLGAESFNSEENHKVTPKKFDVEIEAGLHKMSFDLNMGSEVLLWDEFHPNLYLLKAVLTSSFGRHIKQQEFGMREFKIKGSRFEVNGRPVFLRGTLECSIFPLTGYPSTSVDDWIKIFKTCKSHGLNHVRFHSHCPPEAAFKAADRTGIYLQVEAASWANSGSQLGANKPIDEWLYREGERIIKAYGNYPSFCMMAYGNEPAGIGQKEYLNNFVAYFKERDNRRVYTGGAGWPKLKENEFFVGPEPRIQGWGQQLQSVINKYPPETQYDFRSIIRGIDKPYVSHEIGQWCVYPNFKEIEKYRGVLKAKNFEIFKETLFENGLGHLSDSLLLASGKLQALCYKADIEAALRTPGFAGFQLLDLHDFPGQGTALVGVLDTFWEQKGYISPQEFRAFCSKTVPLARMEKRIYRSNERFKAHIEVAHFGEQTLVSPEISWTIVENNKVLESGQFRPDQIAIDNAQQIGEVLFSLEQFQKPKKLTLKVNILESTNSWDFWVYPDSPPIPVNMPFITDVLDLKAKQILEKGGNVLWSLKEGTLKQAYGGNIKVGFSSIFWNTAWTNGQAPHTLGILCNPEHKALEQFPTEYHSNWQWWDAMKNAQAIRLDKISGEIKPIIRIIDDWFENRNLAMIFEVKVGKGKIIVCGSDLITDQQSRPEANQLIYSLISYMNGPHFDPNTAIGFEELRNISK